MLRWFRKGIRQSLTFEERIARLGELDFKLRPGVSIADLLDSWGREDLESGGWMLTLAVLGSESETQEGVGDRNSPDILYWDTECIEDHGDYVMFARAMKMLYAGQLRLEDVADRVDFDARKAELSFSTDGQRFSSPMRFNDDWIDERAVEMIVSVAARLGVSRRVAHIDDGGQCMLLVAGERSSIQALKELTGIKMVVLEGDPKAFPPVDR